MTSPDDFFSRFDGQGLPDGWRALRTRSEPSEIYYFHERSEATQWERPTADAQQGAADVTAEVTAELTVEGDAKASCGGGSEPAES